LKNRNERKNGIKSLANGIRYGVELLFNLCGNEDTNIVQSSLDELKSLAKENLILSRIIKSICQTSSKYKLKLNQFFFFFLSFGNQFSLFL
jgi:hypothetical protein